MGFESEGFSNSARTFGGIRSVWVPGSELNYRGSADLLRSLGFTWRVGDLGKWLISRLISTLKGILIGVMILKSLQKSLLTKSPDPLL